MFWHLSMLLVVFRLLRQPSVLKQYWCWNVLLWSLHCKLFLTESGLSQQMHLPPCQLLMLFPLNIPFGLHCTANYVFFSSYCLRRVWLVELVLPNEKLLEGIYMKIVGLWRHFELYCKWWSAALTEEILISLGTHGFLYQKSMTKFIELKIKSEVDEENFWSMQSRCVVRAEVDH